MTLKFQIQQIALCPRNPSKAIELLTELGLSEWARDHVVAHGELFGSAIDVSEADLAFNYQATGNDPEMVKPLETEVLHYTRGPNWMDGYAQRVSHLGMHCTEEQLEEFRAFFDAKGIKTAQELFTDSHSNPVIDGKRKYHYAIFDTYDILGVDLKFIVREYI